MPLSLPPRLSVTDGQIRVATLSCRWHHRCVGEEDQRDAAISDLESAAAPPRPLPAEIGEAKVEIHKPKPFHNWREFAGEVGIIVLGVLIALSAEQFVESLHWRHKIEAVQEAVHNELVNDDLPQAYARVVIAHCLSEQLNNLRMLAKPGSDGAAFLKAAARYAPPYRTWDADGLRLVEQSDLAAHLSTEQLDAIQQPYRYVSRIEPIGVDEVNLRSDLQRSRYGTGALSAADAAQISDAIDTLQVRNRAMTGASYALLKTSAAMAGGELSPAIKQRVMAEAREVYGACAAEFVPPNSTGDHQISAPSGDSIFTGI